MEMQQHYGTSESRTKEAEVKDEEEDPPIEAVKASKFRAATMSLQHQAREDVKSQEVPAADGMQVIDMYKDSTAAKAVGLRLGLRKLQSLGSKTSVEQHEVKAERLQLYESAEEGESEGLGAKAEAANALEPYDDVDFRQRRRSRSRGSYCESSEWAVIGAVGQENKDLDPVCFQCGQKTKKTLKDRKELESGHKKQDETFADREREREA